MNQDIANPTYEVFAYLHKFKKHVTDDNKSIWYLRASLIVDKRRDESKPFVFQSVSLQVKGSAYKFLEFYETDNGANEAYGLNDDSGRNKPYLLRIKGYRVEPDPSNTDYPFKILGRIINIDDQDEG